jgi:hypothetical protein
VHTATPPCGRACRRSSPLPSCASCSPQPSAPPATDTAASPSSSCVLSCRPTHKHRTLPCDQHQTHGGAAVFFIFEGARPRFTTLSHPNPSHLYKRSNTHTIHGPLRSVAVGDSGFVRAGAGAGAVLQPKPPQPVLVLPSARVCRRVQLHVAHAGRCVGLHGTREPSSRLRYRKLPNPPASLHHHAPRLVTAVALAAGDQLRIHGLRRRSRPRPHSDLRGRCALRFAGTSGAVRTVRANGVGRDTAVQGEKGHWLPLESCVAHEERGCRNTPSPFSRCLLHTPSPFSRCLLHTPSPFSRCLPHSPSPFSRCLLHSPSPFSRCLPHSRVAERRADGLPTRVSHTSPEARLAPG